MTQSTLRKSLLGLLLAASAPAFAASYYIVTPVPGKTVARDAITVALGSASAPAGQVGSPYPGLDLRTHLSVTGDPDFTGYGVKWQVVSGSLPAGLSLSADGRVTGTPTAAGTSSFTVRATYKTKSGDQVYQVTTYVIEVALAAGAPPQALVGQPYSYDLRSLLSVEGDPSFMASNVGWAVVASSLPAGLYLSSDGRIQGTPTAGGSGSITARATYKGVSGDQTYQVVSLNIVVALAAKTLPFGVTGDSYGGFDFKSLVTVTGDPTFSPGATTWSLAAGSLPPGLTMTADGVLSGTPSTTVTASFTLQAAYRNASQQRAYTLQVFAPKVAWSIAAQNSNYGTVTVGSAVTRSFTFTNTGNTAATGLQASVTGAGLTVTASTCGTPGAPVSLANGESCSVSARYAPTSAGTMAGAVVVNWVGPEAGTKSYSVSGAAKVDYSGLMADYTADAITIERNAAWADGIQWYWVSPDAQFSAPAETVEFRRTITVAGTAPVSVYLYGAVDNSMPVLSVNGETVYTDLGLYFSLHSETPVFTLQPGVNVIAVKVANLGTDANPAGMALQLRKADGTVLASETGWKFRQ